jgi:hypothetical protein
VRWWTGDRRGGRDAAADRDRGLRRAAGAVAILEGGDPHDAAEHAIPGWSGAHIDVAVHARTVRVRVRPPAVLRSVGDLLASTAEAKADR